MKKLARLILSCLVVVNVFVSTAFAATPLPAAYTTVDQESVLCAKDVKYSIKITDLRIHGRRNHQNQVK